MKTAKEKFVAKQLGEEEDDTDAETYEMNKQEAIDEHRRLIKLLRTGTKAELLEEADKQEEELNGEILEEE